MDTTLKRALRSYSGLRNQVDQNLLGEESSVWETELKKFLRKEPCWVPAATNGATSKVMPAKKLLLEDVSTFSLADQPALVARDCFKKDTSKKASPKISYLGDNFSTWFLGKMEEAVPATELAVRRLTENSRDDRILAELDGSEETTLSQFLALLILQGQGEEGMLLVNGYANIFYIKDVNGVLRAVFAYWLGDGWNLEAGPVDLPDVWGADIQVVSRKKLES